MFSVSLTLSYKEKTRSMSSFVNFVAPCTCESQCYLNYSLYHFFLIQTNDVLVYLYIQTFEYSRGGINVELSNMIT